MSSCEEISSSYKAKYCTLSNALPIGLLLLNLAGEIVEANQFAVDMFGATSKDDLVSLDVLGCSSLATTGISDIVIRCIDTKQKQSKIVNYTSKWQKQLHIKASACPVLDESEQVCFVLFICEDLNEIEILKEKYWKIARTFAKVVDAIHSHAIWCKDESGVFQVVNEAYADMFGLRPMDIVGKTDSDLFPAEQCRKYRQDDVDVLSSCGALEVEEDVYDPRYGENRKWRTIKTSVCDDNGRGVVVVGIGEDIHDRYLRRESAKKAIEELTAFIEKSNIQE